jgi:hypothetical protein
MIKLSSVSIGDGLVAPAEAKAKSRLTLDITEAGSTTIAVVAIEFSLARTGAGLDSTGATKLVGLGNQT